MRYFCLYFY